MKASVNSAPRPAILVSHPIQYLSPVFRSLSALCPDLLVIYRTKKGVNAYLDRGFDAEVSWDIDLLGGYNHIFLSEKESSDRGIETSIVKTLLNENIDVLLVHGYNHPTNVLAILMCRLLGAKALIRGDSQIPSKARYSTIKATSKKALFRLLFGAISIGSRNTQYYQTHGIKKERIFKSPLAVDHSNFSYRSDSERQHLRTESRSQRNISSSTTLFVFVAKLVGHKRCIDLLSTTVRLLDAGEDIGLYVVGSGPERRQLEDSVPNRHRHRIHFLGFKNQTELRPLYAAADILVLPSTYEPWGLVVNEAMCAGVPAIVSDAVGAGDDLILDRDCGEIFQTGNLDDLYAKMKSYSSSREKVIRHSVNARRIIEDWDVHTSAHCLKFAIESARTA